MGMDAHIAFNCRQHGVCLTSVLFQFLASLAQYHRKLICLRHLEYSPSGLIFAGGPRIEDRGSRIEDRGARSDNGGAITEEPPDHPLLKSSDTRPAPLLCIAH